MIFAVCMGILSAFVVLIVCWRLGIKKFMGYPAFMDAFVTVALAWLLHGSYVGMVAAIIGGLVFSGMITVIRKAYGYSRLERKGLRIVWVEYEGTWHKKVRATAQNATSTISKGTNQCLNLKLSGVQIACIAALFVLLCGL